MEKLKVEELQFIFKLLSNELVEQKFSSYKDNDLQYLDEVKELIDKIWNEIKLK